MTRISDLLAFGPTFSYEVFPPKTPAGRTNLDRCVAELAKVDPSFVSVTYGAGGSTRELTRELVSTIQDSTGMPTMAHLTCVAHTTTELHDLLGQYRAAGIDNILALGGDPPVDAEGNTVDSGGDLAYASDLVELVAEHEGFCVAVAAQPELHPRSPDRDTDRRHLAHKLAMADFAITQFFFEAHHYHTMVDELRALGVDKPVIPGIMPVTNLASVGRMAAMSGAAFPDHIHERFEPIADDADAVWKLGVELATELSVGLLEAGAPGVHVYTLNRPEAALAIRHGISGLL